MTLSRHRVYPCNWKQHEGAVRLRNRDDLPYKDEETLIAAYLAGDRPAVDYVADHIEAVAWKFPPLREQIDDIVQEVHLRLIRNLTQGRFSSMSSFEHYVRTIALYVCVDLVRRRKPTEAIDGSDSHAEISEERESVLDRLAREEDVDQMLLCLDQLSMICRDILRLRFWEEKSHGEIAKLMEVAVATSRGRLRRCLDKLGDLFGKRKKRKR